MCNWVTFLYSRKWTEHSNPAIMEKIKIIINGGGKAFLSIKKRKRKKETWEFLLWHSGNESCRGTGVAMSCGVGYRHGLDPALLWFWQRPTATAPIWPLAWEPPYASGMGINTHTHTHKEKKRKKHDVGSGKVLETECHLFCLGIMLWRVCLCVWVCLCVKERARERQGRRERGREGESEGERDNVHKRK